MTKFVDPSLFPLTRRDFLQSAATAAGAAALPMSLNAGPLLSPTPDVASHPMAAITLHVNGAALELKVEPRTTLLDALRETLKLSGTKKGCDRGQCGACTVLVDGRRINSCLTLAVMHENDHIITVEGLAQEGQLHPIQAAFLDHDAFQCGFCTPGQLCSAVGFLAERAARAGPAGLADAEIREGMSGNLCRCGAYPNIVAAIRAVSAADGPGAS